MYYLMCGEKYVNADLELVDEPLDIWAPNYSITDLYYDVNGNISPIRFTLYTPNNNGIPEYIVDYESSRFRRADQSQKCDFHTQAGRQHIYVFQNFNKPLDMRVQHIVGGVRTYSPKSSIDPLKLYLIATLEFDYVLK
jgi:hypothetical protein